MGMAREWVRAGHEVHVITGPGDRGGEYTPDLLAAAEATGASVHRAEAPGLARPDVLRPAYERTTQELVATRVPSRLRQIVHQWRHFPDHQRSWIGPAFRLAVTLHGRARFDVVWTTSPPESVHFVGRALATRANVAWVADFRDQWSDYLLARWDAISRRVIDGITRRVLAPAAAVTAATDGVAESLRRAAGRDAVCVRNGFDPMPDTSERPLGRVLGYFGRIDPLMQKPERLWPPLRRLRDGGALWRVEFYLVPGGGGGRGVDVPSDLSDCVHVLAPLPHAEAVRRMRIMTALLVLAWETRGGETSVGGKVYEYVGSGRPVLVCAPRGFEARELVESTGAGVGAWDAEEIEAALRALETFVVKPQARDGLSRGRFAGELLDLFARLPSGQAMR